jgi:hypothetical protein
MQTAPWLSLTLALFVLLASCSRAPAEAEKPAPCTEVFAPAKPRAAEPPRAPRDAGPPPACDPLRKLGPQWVWPHTKCQETDGGPGEAP